VDASAGLSSYRGTPRKILSFDKQAVLPSQVWEISLGGERSSAVEKVHRAIGKPLVLHFLDLENGRGRCGKV
jgi:hypothetical protein